LVSDDGLDLLRKMLVYDKNLRITPIQAMNHPYFNPVKQLLGYTGSQLK
jgi:casein kinase II subunit alpha